MKYFITVALVAILLQGCATGYQKSGFGGGFTETQLDVNVFRISFRGNGFTDKDRVADFTLLRSAELTLQNGFQYFSIIDASTSTSHSTYTTPTTATTNVNASTYGSAYSYGNNTTYNANTYGTATTTVSGGQTYNISKPRASNTIVCFKEKPKSGFSYNASFIYKNITAKYGLTNGEQ